MAEFADFFPIFARTEEDMREDMDVRANDGLTPDDPDWCDTRPGSMYYLATQNSIIECAILWDRMNEAVAAAILATSWGDALDRHAESYNEERIAASYATGFVTFTGANGTLVGTGTRVSPEQVDPEVEPPYFETTASGTIAGGTLTLPVRAVDEGENGNVAANTVTLLQTGIGGIETVNNADEFSNGAEEETDDALKKRLMLIFGGQGSGTIATYVREALKWPNVGQVKVIPNTPQPGHVTVSILDDDGDPLDAAVVTALQDHLDPNPGQGEGWAPINHQVTVSTPVGVVIYISASPVFRSGFSLDGADGTIATRDDLEEALREYVDELQAGDDVIYNHVLAQFFTVEGILNVDDLKIDTVDPPVATGNIAISDVQVAQSGTITLS